VILASLSAYNTTFQFGLVSAVFALAVFVSLWSGVLSLFPIVTGAIGGFMYASLSNDHGIGLWVAMVIVAVVGAVAALVASFALLRLETHYMAMATIAMVLITRVIILNLDVTGGASGVALVRQSARWQLVAVVVIACWILARLRRSRFGLAVETVREDARVASALGISVSFVQTVALMISGALGAVAGLLQADLLQYIGPNTYYTDLGFVTLAAVVLGGVHYWAGPVIGALVFAFLPELLGEIFDTGEKIANGVILIVVMVYLPRGLVDPTRFGRLVASRVDPAGGDPPAAVPVAVDVAAVVPTARGASES